MDFLLEITKESKHATQVVRHLHRTTLEQLSLDPNSPWDNKGYIASLEAEILLKNQKKNAEDSLSVTLTTVPREDEKYLFDEAQVTIKTFEKILERIKSVRENKLKATESNKRPRILRVAGMISSYSHLTFSEKLQLSPGETRILEHILMSAIFTHKGNFYLPQDALSIASTVDLTSQDILNFLSANRTHIKQNMFEYFDPDHPLTSSLILAPEVMMALSGMELTDERLLKIDNTVVAEVIQQERPRDLNKSTTEIIDPNNNAAKDEPQEEPDQEVDDIVVITPPAPEVSLPQEEVSQNQNEPQSSAIRPKSQVQEDDYQESLDLHEFLKREIEAEKHIAPPMVKVEQTEDGNEKLTPYTSDLDFLETECKALVSLFQISQMETQKRENRTYNYNYRGDDFQQESRLRELRAQARVNKKKCEKRLALTKESGEWLPRVERMAQIRGLDNFEKQLTLALIGTHISAELETLGHRRGTTVGFLLRAFCSSFEEQIQARSYFYKNSKLIKEGIIRMAGGTALDNDLMDSHVTIDRRMLEFAMGLDTEFSELVEGSHLYFPKVNLDQVVLPEDTKKLIMSTVENFEGFKRARKRMGLDEAFSYGGGIVMLFFGASGTGKTMMANSIANHMQKKILLINFPSLGRMSAGENLKFIFREAKINDAILFFDECESIFESRERGHYDVNLLLTEIERHDGLIVMATNRAFDLDEAMHRRITLAIEFQKPDPILREKIWRANIPKDLVLDPSVNLKDLAMQFELTGGFIKNAIISALSMAVGRDGEKNASIKQEDLEQGARLQLRGRLRMIDFNHRVVPTHGLESLVLHQDKIKVLKEIISFEKARQILFSQWGFDKMIGTDQATSCLFWGPPGTGKTMAAEAIAFSTGKPLKVINIGELISKWVGETSKNINAVFEEAAAHDAVLVFDEADSLFGTRTAVSTSTDRYANADVGLLLYHMEHFRGVVVLCTNMVTQIDQAFFRRMKFVIEFSIPDIADRVKLWQQAIPKECPLSKDVDFHKLASKFEFPGGNIKSSVVRAATRAALREDNRVITMADLEQAAKEEQEKQGKNNNAQLYS